MNDNNLRNKVALVTGASRGIGKAVALALADEGIQIAVNYKNNKEKADEVCKLILEKGVKTVAVQADVSEADSVSKMISTIEKELGNISILINNAGIAFRQKIEETAEKDFDETIKINLKSNFLVTQAVLTNMRKNKWGRIIMISSTAAQIGGAVGLHYAASKAGQIGMMHFYAANLAKEGITVNAIAPALIETDMLNELGNIKPDLIPLGRFGSAKEIADAAVMLVKNGYISNQVININGGLHPSS
ncbi:MAG: 3-oxoacyl-ACP reductase FabG [Ignavibacteriaceae bacterium]|jgi:3-oxoacyl-[acyl-carrier protein] reductase